jgi:hypothetical protein
MKLRLTLPILILLALLTGTAGAQAPRVPPQEPGPDGSLVHVVGFGDTLQGIMAAYAPYGITLEGLQELNGWRFPPQFIFVDDLIVILPPGSADPGSGMSAPAAAPPAAAPPSDAPPADASAPADAAPVDAAPEAPRLSAEQIAAIAPVEAIQPFLP